MPNLPPRRSPVFFLVADTGEEDLVWQPRADIYRTRTGWLVKLELAGVRAEDIAIHARGSQLKISGTRRDFLIESAWCCYSLEIAYSRFERLITLPCNLEAARIVTQYAHGMLLVNVITEGS